MHNMPNVLLVGHHHQNIIWDGEHADSSEAVGWQMLGDHIAQ